MYLYEIVLRHYDGMKTHYKLEHECKFSSNDLNNFIKSGAASLPREDMKLSLGDTIDDIIDNYLIRKLGFEETENNIQVILDFDYDTVTDELFR